VLLSFLASVILKQVSGGLAMQAAASAVGIALIIAAASFLTWVSGISTCETELAG
jgi:hypothetical protein